MGRTFKCNAGNCLEQPLFFGSEAAPTVPNKPAPYSVETRIQGKGKNYETQNCITSGCVLVRRSAFTDDNSGYRWLLGPSWRLPVLHSRVILLA